MRDTHIFLNTKIKLRRGVPPKTHCRHLARSELDGVAPENGQKARVAENHASTLQWFLHLRKRWEFNFLDRLRRIHHRVNCSARIQRPESVGLDVPRNPAESLGSPHG